MVKKKVSSSEYCFLYRVGKTETYFQIAQHYGITPETLMRANPQIKGAYTLYPGQFIGIPIEVFDK